MQERLLFVNLRTNVPGTEEIRKAHLDGHRRFLAELEKTGKVLLHGRFADDSGALQILAAGSADEAKALLSGDPFSIHGAIKDDIRPWNCRLTGVTLNS